MSSLYAAHAFIHAGLCFGRLPRHWVERDCAAGTLVPLRMQAGGYKEVHPYLSGIVTELRIEAETE